MKRAQALLLAVLLLGSGVSCSLLEDPSKPWQRDLLYEEILDADGKVERIKVSPTELRVDGPWGFVLVTNETAEKRGFAMDGPAVYAEIRSETTARIRVEELEDGQEYTFYDHRNEVKDADGNQVPLGTFVVRYVPEDQR